MARSESFNNRPNTLPQTKRSQSSFCLQSGGGPYIAQWHNFLRLNGGTVDFGKLTMHNADLTLIDASDDPWFDLDLVNYQAQLVRGFTRITPQFGLEMFMPNFDSRPQNRSSETITLDWLKNRDRSLPHNVSGVVKK